MKTEVQVYVLSSLSHLSSDNAEFYQCPQPTSYYYVLHNCFRAIIK